MRNLLRLLLLAGVGGFVLPTSCPGQAGALSEAERHERYSACFGFASLVSGGSVVPHWLDDGARFWYATGDGSDGETWIVTTASGERQPHSAPSAADTDPIVTLPGTAGLASPTDGAMALIRDHDLWLVEGADGDTVRITHDGTEDAPWYLEGALWSADGKYLAVMNYDVSPAPTIPIVDWLDPLAPVERVPHPQADRPRGTARVTILSIADGQAREVVMKGMAEPLVHLVGWIEATSELLILRFDRVMQHQQLLAVEAETGGVRTVVAEDSDTFIDGLAAVFLLDAYHHPLTDGERFLWLSQRDGYRHLYLYRYDGTLERRLTEGLWPVVNVEAVDEGNGWVYFQARCDGRDPTSRHLCRVRLDGTGFRQLTVDSGRRSIHISPDFNCFVDNHSDLDRPPRSDLRSTDGRHILDLATADVTALEAMDWQPPRRIVARAADGRSECHCAIYLPPGFDPDRKYAVIEVIYAGPQWMIVPRRFIAGEYGDTAAALAQLGYVTVIIDSPGTAGIGRAYQDAVYGKLGQIEIPDHVAAIRDLAATRPWMDLDRVGVHGKSWGGYFALRAMLMAPDFYRVGVASAAVADLATTAESPVVPYLGLPADNPDAYAAADCLALADRLQGDLLLTIGTEDRNTPFGQSMRMLAAFSEAGQDVDVLVLPGQHHWLQGASFARWQRALRDHFTEHLPR